MFQKWHLPLLAAAVLLLSSVLGCTPGSSPEPAPPEKETGPPKLLPNLYPHGPPSLFIASITRTRSQPWPIPRLAR